MRKATLLAAALVVSALAAVPAFAATTDNTVAGSIKSTKAGTTKKPVGHALFTQVTTTNDDGTQPPPVRTTVINYPKNLEFNNKAFKVCSKALLDAQGPTACPKGSQVGTGSSDAILGSAPLKDIKVTAFNGGNGKIELYVGAPLQKTIEGVQKGGKGKPKTLTFSVPKEAINPVGNTFSSIIRFGATIKASTKVKGKTVNFVESTGCPKGGMPLTAKFTYATRADFPALPDNLVSGTPSDTASSKIKCSAR